MNWPVQQEPGMKGFAIWIKCLKECFNMQTSGGITHRLGKWLPGSYHSQNKCNAYYQPSTGLAFIDDLYLVLAFSPISTGTGNILCNKNDSTLVDTIPTDCIPAVIQHHNAITTLTFSKLAT